MAKAMFLVLFELGFGFVIPFLAFGLVFIFVVAGIFITIVKNAHKSNTIKNGKKQMAKFLKVYKGRVDTKIVGERLVSNTQYYGIYYEMRTKQGDIVKAKSPDKYLYEEAQAFKEAGYFEIFTNGEFSVIAGVPSKRKIEQYALLQELKTCSYCNSRIKVDKDKCPHCGASSFEDII